MQSQLQRAQGVQEVSKSMLWSYKVRCGQKRPYGSATERAEYLAHEKNRDFRDLRDRIQLLVVDGDPNPTGLYGKAEEQGGPR